VVRLHHGQAERMPSAMQTIGGLYLGSEHSVRTVMEGLRSGLADLGYTDGGNIQVLYRLLTSGTTAIRAVHAAADIAKLSALLYSIPL